MKNHLKLIKSSKASSMVEYALLIALVSVISIGSLRSLSSKIEGKYNCISTNLESGGSFILNEEDGINSMDEGCVVSPEEIPLAVTAPSTDPEPDPDPETGFTGPARPGL